MTTHSRQFARAPIEVEVSLSSDHNFYTGLTNDISEGGLFVATYTPPPPGTQLEIRLQLPGAPGPYVFIGEVRWTRSFEASCDGAPPGCGIQWLALPAGAHERIHAFVSQRESIYYEGLF